MVTSFTVITNCIDQHLYVPKEETFPLKHVETRPSIDNASEHTLNDNWNEESDVALSEECKTRHYFDKLLDRVWLSQQAGGTFEKEWYESFLPSASFILAEAAWRVCICNER